MITYIIIIILFWIIPTFRSDKNLLSDLLDLFRSLIIVWYYNYTDF